MKQNLQILLFWRMKVTISVKVHYNFIASFIWKYLQQNKEEIYNLFNNQVNFNKRF